MAMTLEQRAEMIREAYRKKAQDALPPGIVADTCGIDVMDDAIVVYGQADDQLYRIPWSVASDGSDLSAIQFGDPVAVVCELVPVSEAVDLAGMSAPEGKEWEVTICKPGLSVNGYYYEKRVLEAAAPLFRDAPVYAFELTPGHHGHVADRLVADKPRLAKNLVGRIVESRVGADGAVTGRLAILGADWLRQKLMDAWTRGVAGLGLSHDSVLSWAPATIAGAAAKWVSRFARVDSVDVVTAPSAGGAFERAVAGSAGPQEEHAMKELLEKLRQIRPDLVAGLGETPSTERVAEAIAAALQGTSAIRTAQDETTKEMRRLLDEAKAAHCGALLDRRVSEAQLPEVSAKGLRKRFEGRVFEAAELELAITEKKEELDTLAKSGQVKAEGTQRVVEGMTSARDKLQASLDKAFGLPAPDPATAADRILDEARATEAVDAARAVAGAYAGVRGFRGLMAAYLAYGGDPEQIGTFRTGRATEEINSGSFAVALANTMARRLVMDYRVPKYWEELLITSRKSVKDFRQQEANQIGYFGDLDDVDPETADYQEIAAPAADTHATYTVGQKGNLLTITRKTLINDDINTVQTLVRRLGRAARRTHARHIWLPVIANSVIYDGAVLFIVAGHGNLTATAFGTGAVQAMILLMRRQTEPDSAERIAFEGGFNLFGPPELEFAMNVACKPGPDSPAKTAADTSLIGLVTPHLQPLFTDLTDWVLTGSPEDCEMIEVGYLNGREEPELFLADQPTVGQMFVADKIVYKIRHEYGRTVVDYRGMGKSVNP